MDAGKTDARPGLRRAVLEALAITVGAVALGLVANGARRLPLALAGPAPRATDSCMAPAAEDARPVPFIAPSLAARRHGTPGVVFVDARPHADFVTAHVADAVSLPADEPLDPPRLAPLLAAKLVIVYCDRPQCGLSTRLGQRLRERGIADVRVLAEGWHAWIAAGYPAQSGGF